MPWNNLKTHCHTPNFDTQKKLCSLLKLWKLVNFI